MKMSDFAPVLQLGEVMKSYGRPWYLSGGWAIDAWLGRVTRPHADLEISILRSDQFHFRTYLAGWTFTKAVTDSSGNGGWFPWCEGEYLEMPRHQVRACRDHGELRVLEAFLNEGDSETWQSRRHKGLSRSMRDVCVVTPLHIPVIAPEIQLLYKAKYHRPKDDEDFRAALPSLSASQRQWLKSTLDRFHPGDPWISDLQASV